MGRSLIFIKLGVLFKFIMDKGSKNISIKMLKDVGMTVPKSRETSVVYICSNTGNERLYLYAARQRMKAVYYMHQDRE